MDMNPQKPGSCRQNGSHVNNNNGASSLLGCAGNAIWFDKIRVSLREKIGIPFSSVIKSARCSALRLVSATKRRLVYDQGP